MKRHPSASETNWVNYHIESLMEQIEEVFWEHVQEVQDEGKREEYVQEVIEQYVENQGWSDEQGALATCFYEAIDGRLLNRLTHELTSTYGEWQKENSHTMWSHGIQESDFI